MRSAVQRGFVGLAFAVMAHVPAMADPWDITIFVPSQAGVSAHPLNLETREIQRVLDGAQGRRPAECPAQAYWAINPLRLARCADGPPLELRETSKVGFIGAFALIPRP